MLKYFTPDTYLQTGRAEEIYAVPYKCMTCHGTWSGQVNSNPAFPGEWPGVFRFCPCCGIKFEGQLERQSEEREQLRCDAGWKGYYWAKAQKITYTIQRLPLWHDGSGVIELWETDSSYFPSGTRQEVLRAWRNRLRDGSMFGEEVRLVARTPSGEKVVFGPVTLAPDTHDRPLFVWRGGKRELKGRLNA